jgi:hypothetical protein
MVLDGYDIEAEPLLSMLWLIGHQHEYEFRFSQSRKRSFAARFQLL